jgi:hypothetical protein
VFETRFARRIDIITKTSAIVAISFRLNTSKIRGVLFLFSASIRESLKSFNRTLASNAKKTAKSEII